MLSRSSQSGKRLVAVDLTPMLPGGENGGLKIAVLEFLSGLVTDYSHRLAFIFLVTTDAAGEATERFGETGEIVLIPSPAGRSGLRQAFFQEFLVKPKVLRTLARRRIDILYCPLGFINFEATSAPIIVTVADLLHRDFPYSLDWRNRIWRHVQFRKLTMLASKYQLLSNFSADRLRENYRVPREKIFVNYQPVHRRLVNRDSETITLNGRPKVTEHFPDYFFYPANFWVHKNHETLLIAYQRYLRKNGGSGWELWLTGEFHERLRSLHRFATDLGISNKVRFLGYVPVPSLSQIYQRAGAIVFPSLYEGFGIPLVEAMSFHKPVICGRDGSMAEIMGSAGFYVDGRKPLELSAALYDVANDPALRGELARRSAERISEFSFEREVDTFADVILGMPRIKKRMMYQLFSRLHACIANAQYCAEVIMRDVIHRVLGEQTSVS